MIGIVIVAHGGLAREYLAAVEHVLGAQENMHAVSFAAQENRDDKRIEIGEVAESVDTGGGVVIVTDMFGGSPSNLSIAAAGKPGRRILYGANLPMLIKLVKSRHLSVAEAVENARSAGRKYLDCYDGFDD
jgi:PTS system mannose-specific IIA component